MGVYEAVKDAISVAQKADNLELLRQLLDLQKEIQDIQQENFELKKKIGELESIIEKRRNVMYNTRRTAVYEVDEQGERNGPYCTHCWESDNKLISLRDLGNNHYQCPHCKIPAQNCKLQ